MTVSVGVQDTVGAESSPPEDDHARRRDLTPYWTVTLDPAGSVERDDALSVRSGDGDQGDAWRLFVHIADINVAVSEDPDLERIARNRWKTVYDGEAVDYMLPRERVQQLSLDEGTERYANTIEIVIDDSAVTEWEIYPSVIRPDRNLSYGEAGEYLSGSSSSPTASGTDTIPEVLQDMKAAAETLSGERGAQETFDSNPAERLVEECMVYANRYVAHVLEASGEGIFRVHGNVDDLEEKATQYLEQAGLGAPPIDAQRHPPDTGVEAPERYFLDGYEDGEAAYSVVPLPHKGVGFDRYTHATAPLRRYVDFLNWAAIYTDERMNIYDMAALSSGQCAEPEGENVPDENAENLFVSS